MDNARNFLFDTIPSSLGISINGIEYQMSTGLQMYNVPSLFHDYKFLSIDKKKLWCHHTNVLSSIML